MGRGEILVRGPSISESPKTFPPFLAMFSMMFKDSGWNANAGANPVTFMIEVASSMKIRITSFMSVALFLNVTVLNL
jgi:hypothetical protein